MIEENPKPTHEVQREPAQTTPSASKFSQPDDVEYVGAPSQLTDAEEVPDWLSSIAVYIFALPVAIIEGLSSLFAALYAATGVFSLLIGFFVVLCLLLSCLLAFVV